jgi:hypothetical protein
MPKTTVINEKDRAIALLAKAFGLPVAGINLEERLGKKAYINALGLDSAWKKWPMAVRITDINRLSIYKTVGDSALVEITGLDEHEGKHGAIGSASAANMTMIKGYPNELAETRALNRLLRRVLLPRLYEEYGNNIAAMQEEDVAFLATYVNDFGRVSIEEMPAEGEGDQTTSQLPLITNEQMEEIKPLLENILFARTKKELEDVGDKIKDASLDFTATQVNKLRDAYKSKKDKLIKESENAKPSSADKT